MTSVGGWRTPSASFFLGGALFYLHGTILVTMPGSLSLNDQLAAVSATDSIAPMDLTANSVKRPLLPR